MSGLLAQTGWVEPVLDYHALAPEMILGGVIFILLTVDLVLDERSRWATSTIAGVGLLASLVPILTLAVDGADRSLFGGAYVVDNYALVLKAFFLVSGYVTILLSMNYIGEGDYYQGEYYLLLLSSLLGMVIMSSARDLITIFVALELLSLPTFMLASWRKRDLRSNEAGLKYFLLGVFASAVMLYGMSLVYGVTGTTLLTGIREGLTSLGDSGPVVVVGILFVLVGFAFKISAVPFHSWAPDTYEGAPTPVTAFLSVASKAAGFVAMVTLVLVAFQANSDVWAPVFWVLAALSLTVGNLVALRQTNIVRMLAYSSVAQGGFILLPLAAIGDDLAARESALEAIVTYLIIYGAMNLGAFAVVLAVARKTRSAEISSFGGLFEYAPGLGVALTIFLFSLAGIPPLGGWFAKLTVFRSLLDAGGTWAVVLAIIAALNTVISFYYYAGPVREVFFRPPPDEDRTPIRIPASLGFALGLTAVVTIAFGVVPQIVARFGDLTATLGG